MHAWFVFWILSDPLVFPRLVENASSSSAYKAMPLPLSPTFSVRFLNGFSVLSNFRIDEINVPQFSSVIEFWFFDSPLLLCDMPDTFSGRKQSGPVVARIFVSRVPDHIYPLGCLSFNNVNFVHSVQESDNL